MQEDKSTISDRRKKQSTRLNTLLIIGPLAILCLAIGAIAVAVWPAGPLPTAAPRAFARDVVSTPAPVATPPPPTPATPQPGGRSAGDAYIPELGNSGYDAQHYTIQLALDPAEARVSGATSIEALSNLEGLSQISLDFAGYEVGGVTVDGLATAFRREDKKLVVDLPRLMRQGESFALVVTYAGAPLEEPSPYLRFVEHLGLHYPDGETIFAIAEPDGARYWFPANDHPRDKATFRFEIAVPSGLAAVANGTLIERRAGALPNGQIGELFVWEHRFPMAPYLAVVAVGRYQRLDGTTPGGIPLRHYVFPELQAQTQDVISITGEALEWMAGLFGPYPFESFGFVTARVPGGSMETQTMVLLSDGMIGQRTAVHELAHMWFGNWVSLDSWHEMWRNEGFATYITLMWETRDDPEELELQVEAVRAVVEGNDKNYPLNEPPPEYLFDLNVYFQGAVAVHALRQEMGDEAFFQGLLSYFQRYGGGTASDEQFRAVMEEAAGRSLESYFGQWFPAG